LSVLVNGKNHIDFSDFKRRRLYLYNVLCHLCLFSYLDARAINHGASRPLSRGVC
jgi:hypothetical protein